MRQAPKALLAATIALTTSAPAAAKDVSGQIVALGQSGRVILNLTSLHLRGGERAQVVRRTAAGGWVLAAVGQIVDVSPTNAVLELRRYEPGMLAAEVGDYVVITLVDPTAAGYPGFSGSASGRGAGQGGKTPPDQPQSKPAGPVTPALPPGDQLAVTIGLRFTPGFAGKLPADDAPMWDDSGYAGYGWALGPVVELRAMRYVAVETGLMYNRNTLQKKTTVYRATGCPQGDEVDLELKQAITNDSLRIPFLVKGVLPVDLGEGMEVRTSLGGGAELAFGRSADLDVTVVPECALPGLGDTEAVGLQTFLVVDLGVALAVGNLILSLDLRGGYNPNGTETYKTYLPKDPNDAQSRGGEVVPMGHAADLGVMLGIGYEYDAL